MWYYDSAKYRKIREIKLIYELFDSLKDPDSMSLGVVCEIVRTSWTTMDLVI